MVVGAYPSSSGTSVGMPFHHSLHTYKHTHSLILEQFRHINSLTMHVVSGTWKETGVPRDNNGKNMQTSHRQCVQPVIDYFLINI